MSLEFYRNKSVFVTGHTGFKGAWLCYMLKRAGARVSGYALEPVRGGAYEAAAVHECIRPAIGDVRDYKALKEAYDKTAPEIVLHLAAQPIVLESYKQPAYTFDTNVMGTVNLLECVRQCKTARSAIVVTTDKVYKNYERPSGYGETDVLGGSDPYSASKACAELALESYRASFLKEIPVSSARAGNVVGGGDVSAHRIISDCVRAAVRKEPIIIRNPYSVRPYQHVLEPLFAYLLIAQRQYENPGLQGCYNIGPGESDCIATGELADVFCKAWGGGITWKCSDDENNAAHEGSLLRLDCSKMRSVFGWQPVWNVSEAVAKTVEWEKVRHCGGDVRVIMDAQIDEYMYRQSGESKNAI